MMTMKIGFHTELEHTRSSPLLHGQGLDSTGLSNRQQTTMTLNQTFLQICSQSFAFLYYGVLFTNHSPFFFYKKNQFDPFQSYFSYFHPQIGFNNSLESYMIDL